MEKFSESFSSLRATFEREVLRWPSVSSHTTFGWPSYLVESELFAVVSDQGVSLTRLPDEDRRRLAATHRVSPFVANGRAVASWTTVAVTADDVDALFPAVKKSYESAAAA
ncbi:hypothetical protein SAMN04487948_103129 [Halogranum amylolyticum]|uniref:YjbR protein n=1 Tax=Halogranum amylolyticum TaxID=660520 RepID=A0A1H8QIA7_9EURY|nr:hypothetical protein [Halogranum amylolyticum]SEO53654.1 hypothetical protein SAMN04487948_103129 [Halogranum amylolyticum]